MRLESVGDKMPGWKQVTHGWATPAKMRKKCCYGHKKNLGQNNSLSPSPSHLSHTRNITLSGIKCERYIFIKKCVRSVIEIRILCLIMFRIYLYMYTYSCMWLYNRCLHLIFVLMPFRKAEIFGASTNLRERKLWF